MTISRIYKVSDAGNERTHLVEAGNRAQALRHVAGKTFGVELASQRDLVALLRDGIAVEVADPDPVAPPPEPQGQSAGAA